MPLRLSSCSPSFCPLPRKGSGPSGEAEGSWYTGVIDEGGVHS